jgi:hypothetical protein
VPCGKEKERSRRSIHRVGNEALLFRCRLILTTALPNSSSLRHQPHAVVAGGFVSKASETKKCASTSLK